MVVALLESIAVELACGDKSLWESPVMIRINDSFILLIKKNDSSFYFI